MTQDLAQVAKDRGIRYFMISYTDLFGGQRAKLVPAAAIADMQRDGAGFAGFATWLDMTPAHPDLFAMPDAASLIQLPWKKEVAWVAADCRRSHASNVVSSAGRPSNSSTSPKPRSAHDFATGERKQRQRGCRGGVGCAAPIG